MAVLLALLVTIIDLFDIDMALPRRLAGKTRLVRPRRQLRSKHAPGGQTLKWRLLKTTPVLSVHAMANIDLPGTLTVRTDSFLGLRLLGQKSMFCVFVCVPTHGGVNIVWLATKSEFILSPTITLPFLSSLHCACCLENVHFSGCSPPTHPFPLSACSISPGRWK